MLAMFEGFVLQGLVTPLLSKVVHPNKNNIYMSQMYIIAQRGRIVATILPFFPFWDSFFSLSLQNTQWNDRKTLFDPQTPLPSQARRLDARYLIEPD